MSRMPELDVELADHAPKERWKTWMARVEAILFQSKDPVGRDVLARVVGADCNLHRLLRDLEAELTARPYEVVSAAGGYVLRTRAEMAPAIQLALKTPLQDLTPAEGAVLMTIAYYQPITRAEIGWIIGKKVDKDAVDRDLIVKLRRMGLIANGPRSSEPGAPPMYVTTPAFLAATFYRSLADLPDRDRLEAAGLLNKTKVINGRKALARSMAQIDLGEVAEEEPVEPLDYR